MALGFATLASAQCLEGVQYPDQTATVPCDGVRHEITELSGYAGEYTLVTLTAGDTYTFSSSVGTDFITISLDGETAVAFGQSPVTWTADADGDYMYFVHTDAACGEEEDAHMRYVLCGTAVPPPANDACAGALSIPTQEEDYVYEMTGGAAATDDGFLEDCTDAQNDGTWYSFEGDGSLIAITVQPSADYDPRLAVLSGDCGAFTCISSADGGAAGDEEEVQFLSQEGVTYYINVGFFSGDYDILEGDYTLTLARLSSDLLPENDNCAGAIAIPTQEEEYTYEQTDGENATADGFVSACGGNDGLWFTFEGDGNDVTIEVESADGYDPRVSVYTGSCGSFTCVDSVDDGGSGGEETLTIDATEEGTTYYVNVGYYSSFTDADEGNFTLTVTRETPAEVPANDNCAGAIAIPTQEEEYTYEQTDGEAATSDGLLTTCSDNGQNDGLWFSFVGDGNHVNISVTSGADYDPQVAVFSGTCDELECVGTVDNAGSDDVETISVLNTVMGTTYYINVGHYSGFTDNDEGNFTLSVTRETPPSELPDCASGPTPADGATDVPNGTVTFSWEAPTTGGPVDGYKVYGGTSTPLTEDDYIATVTETSIDLIITGYDTVLYWQAIPINTLGDAEGCIEWSFTTVAPPPAPANDDCDGAIALTPGATFEDGAIEATVFGATDSNEPEPECGSYDGGDVWFSVVVPDSGTLTIEIGGAQGNDAFDSVMAVYTGSCDALVELDCNDDAFDETLFSQLQLTELTPGETLYIRVFEYSNDETEPFSISAYDESLATPGFDLNELKVYPNPVSSVLNLDFNRSISRADIYTIVGQQVMSQEVNATSGRIDMSPLAAGTYLVKILVEGVTKTLKVIKE